MAYFFYKSHFASLVEVILWADSLLHEVSTGDNLSPFHFIQFSIGKAVMTEQERERKDSFGEMALLDRRNGTSRVKKCRFFCRERIIGAMSDAFRAKTSQKVRHFAIFIWLFRLFLVFLPQNLRRYG